MNRKTGAMNKIPILVLINLFLQFANGENVLVVRNKCPYTIWPGTWGQKHIPENGGFRLNSGETKVLTVPYKWTAGRIWPRTKCNNNGKCETGDCSRGIQCNGATARAVTLAEISFQQDSNLNFYDVSLVDGYNVQMSIRPTPGTFRKQDGVKNSCAGGECLNDAVLRECPADLKIPGICQSACERYNKPEYCCSGEYNTPDKCPGAKINKHFKDRCPLAYSYAYDDANDSLFTCPASNYNSFDITFCG